MLSVIVKQGTDREYRHPYHFKYPRLLRSAFIHPSQAFVWEHVPHYQRLEFLGDSLLDQVFIMHLVRLKTQFDTTNECTSNLF